MNVVLPFRGELGMKLWWHAPAVFALAGPKVVYIEEGEEALYPGAEKWIAVERNHDDRRRNHYGRDVEFVTPVEMVARARFGASARYLKPDQKWPRKRFTPLPHVPTEVDCDVVVCPRKRNYGAGKNWDEWPALTARLTAEGLRVFAGGAADSSYDVPCEKAWDHERNLDATIAAMHSARVVVATDAGLAHLAVLCGRPLLMVTYGAGLVAPGSVDDENGRPMEPCYWPVKMERYREANHLGSPITLVHHGWEDPERVLRETQGLIAARAGEP